MSTPQTSLEPPQKAVDRLGFIADLGFILCTVWFILWRSELSGAARGSLWATWWPAIGLGGLVLAALAIGFVQRKPRGFLPYSLRWTFLGILLVLPIWLALSMIEAGSRENSLKSIASEARQEAMQSLALASSDEERQAQQQVIEAADAGLKLAEVLDAAEAKGIAIPKVDLASTLPPEALDRLDPGTVDTLEQALGMADALDHGGLPPELASAIQAGGLDNPKVLLALLGLIAVLLAPALGISAGVILKALQALVIGGKLSLGGLLRVVPALLGSIGPSGIDEAVFSQRMDEFGAMASDFVMMMNTIEQVGGDTVRRSEAFQKVKGIATEASGRPANKRACPHEQEARQAAGGDPAKLRAELASRCPHLKPSDVDTIAGKRR